MHTTAPHRLQCSTFFVGRTTLLIRWQPVVVPRMLAQCSCWVQAAVGISHSQADRNKAVIAGEQEQISPALQQSCCVCIIPTTQLHVLVSRAAAHIFTQLQQRQTFTTHLNRLRHSTCSTADRDHLVCTPLLHICCIPALPQLTSLCPTSLIQTAHCCTMHISPVLLCVHNVTTINQPCSKANAATCSPVHSCAATRPTQPQASFDSHPGHTTAVLT